MRYCDTKNLKYISKLSLVAVCAPAWFILTAYIIKWRAVAVYLVTSVRCVSVAVVACRHGGATQEKLSDRARYQSPN